MGEQGLTTHDFLRAVVAHWPRVNLTDETKETWIGKLYRYNDSERERIFEWLTDHCPMAPAPAKLYEAATDLGILERHQVRARGERPISTVRLESTCPTCKGLGLVHRTGQWDWTEGEGFKAKGIVVTHVADEFRQVSAGDVSMLYRCTCEAGQRQSRGIPQLPLARI